MAGRGFKILLAASLALNLAFIASFVYKKLSPREPSRPRRIEFASVIELSPQQKQEIEKISKSFRLDMVKFKQEILDKRIEIIEELGDPEANLEVVEEKTKELNQLEAQLNHRFVQTLMQVTTVMDSQQRINFLLKLSNNWFFRRSRPPRR
jgi:hypothetical protein